MPIFVMTVFLTTNVSKGICQLKCMASDNGMKYVHKIFRLTATIFAVFQLELKLKLADSNFSVNTVFQLKLT